jgi:hypothetical protein
MGGMVGAGIGSMLGGTMAQTRGEQMGARSMAREHTGTTSPLTHLQTQSAYAAVDPKARMARTTGNSFFTMLLFSLGVIAGRYCYATLTPARFKGGITPANTFSCFVSVKRTNRVTAFGVVRVLPILRDLPLMRFNLLYRVRLDLSNATLVLSCVARSKRAVCALASAPCRTVGALRLPRRTRMPCNRV